MYLFILSLISALFLVASAIGEEITDVKILHSKAQEALGIYSELVNEQDVLTKGLESRGAVRQAVLGQPLQIFWVRLDRLKQYQPGTDPNKLLSGGQQFIYPAMVKGEVKLSVTLEIVKGSPQIISLGSSDLTKILDSVRNDASKSTKLPADSSFVVKVPALHLNFLGNRVNQKLMLTPILDDPGFGFKAGVPLAAEKVFETILPTAKKHKGLPG